MDDCWADLKDRAPDPPASPREQRLAALIDMWGEQLGLGGNWRLRGRIRPVDSESHAEVRFNRYNNQATINLGDDVAEEDWELTVVHELLHLLLDPLVHLTQTLIGQLAERERPIYEQLLEEAEEPLINRLAELLARQRWPWRTEYDT